VCIAVVVGALAVGITGRVLAPKAGKDGKPVAGGQYKYMHCDRCKTELAYNPDMALKRCPRCLPPNPGFFIPTEHSVKAGGGPSPLRWVYVAVTLELIGTLAAVVVILSQPIPCPVSTYYLFHCPNCSQRLRFRRVSLGEIGSCPRCRRPVRFPEEEDAILEAAILERERKRRDREREQAVTGSEE
jgi:hypothetical protein